MITFDVLVEIFKKWENDFCLGNGKTEIWDNSFFVHRCNTGELRIKEIMSLENELNEYSVSIECIDALKDKLLIWIYRDKK